MMPTLNPTELDSKIRDIVTVPFAMRPGMKPIEGPKLWHIDAWPIDKVQNWRGDYKKLFECVEAIDCVRGKIVMSDLALLSKTGVVEAVRINSPSGWAPEDKVGMSFSDLHKPLPGSAEILKKALPGILSLVNQRWYSRTVWTLQPNPFTCQHPLSKLIYDSHGYGWGNPNNKLWFRYEEQYIGPVNDRLLFVINVNLVELEKLTVEQRELIRVSHSTMAPDIKKYKGLDSIKTKDIV